MAIAVTANISIDGGPHLADYHSVSIRQELFSHHSFQVVVPYEMLEKDRSDGFFHQAHQNYCGKPITISLTPTVATTYPSLEFKGVITHITLSNSGDFAHSFVLSGFSPTYLLEDGIQRRTFQKKGLKAIFDEVLTPYQSVVKCAALKPQHQDAVKYVVQYGESNYVFLQRLADAYGEWFYYDGQALRLGSPVDGPALPFSVMGTEGFSMALELKPATFTMNHYDYLDHRPYTGTSGSQSLSQLNPFAAFALKKSEDLFSQPSRFVANRHVRSQSQLNGAIKEWKANHVSSLVTFQGSGENPGFGVGKLMAVQCGPAQARHDYGTYRLTEVTHSVQADQYQNTFVALPDAAQYPAPNPEVHPPMGVPELAEVINVADPQQLGRIRVRYYWPVAKPSDAETGWVRVSTPYSGDGKGQMFTPEVGSQVLVGYEQSGADFPVVLGNLFHPHNKQSASYTPDKNNVKSLQTAGGNKIVFHDEAGKERILISNGKPGKRETKLELSFDSDGAILLKTKGSITLDAKKKISLMSKEISLQADDKITLQATKKITIDSSGTADVQATQAVKIKGQSLEMSAQTTAKLAGQTGVKVEGLTAELSGSSMTTVKGALVKIN